MSLVQRILRFFRRDPTERKDRRIFLQDQELVAMVQDVARQQMRPEEEVAADFVKAGLSQFLSQNEMESRWSSLSRREQQVVALICLGYRNHEIAETLVIAPETVKTHLQGVFNKFNLRSRRELRLALKNWDFRGWWERNQQE